MKQKKKAKICFVIYIAEKSFFFIYNVIVKQKKINALLITTYCCPREDAEGDSCPGYLLGDSSFFLFAFSGNRFLNPVDGCRTSRG